MQKIIILLFFCISMVVAQNKQIYIIHGYNSDSQYGWIPNVAKTLRADNNEVVVPNFPNANAPKLEEWLDTMRVIFTKLDANTYFITHSLGGVALLDFLNTLSDDTKIGGIIMISPFDERLESLPILNEFVEIILNFKKISKITQNIVVISAKDDGVVPTAMSERLARKLGATFMQTPHGGHFMESEGFKDLPLVVEVLEHLENATLNDLPFIKPVTIDSTKNKL